MYLSGQAVGYNFNPLVFIKRLTIVIIIIGLLIAFSVGGKDIVITPYTSPSAMYLQQPTYPINWVLRAKGDACWNTLVMRESGWIPTAVNKSSGACSLAQSLPCSKIQGDWQDPEIALAWMNSYMNDRYGGSCAALQHSYDFNWY